MMKWRRRERRSRICRPARVDRILMLTARNPDHFHSGTASKQAEFVETTEILY